MTRVEQFKKIAEKKTSLESVSKCCMDCNYYIAGGSERNCSYPWPSRQYVRSCVCAIQEACGNFEEKTRADELSHYPKINLRTKKKQRIFKADKL